MLVWVSRREINMSEFFICSCLISLLEAFSAKLLSVDRVPVILTTPTPNAFGPTTNDLQIIELTSHEVIWFLNNRGVSLLLVERYVDITVAPDIFF